MLVSDEVGSSCGHIIFKCPIISTQLFLPLHYIHSVSFRDNYNQFALITIVDRGIVKYNGLVSSSLSKLTKRQSL